jgi:hypothetical protein
MTSNYGVQFWVHPFNTETEATTLYITDMNHIVYQWKREVYCITSKDQMWFKMEFSIRLVDFKPCRQAIGV